MKVEFALEPEPTEEQKLKREIPITLRFEFEPGDKLIYDALKALSTVREK